MQWEKIQGVFLIIVIDIWYKTVFSIISFSANFVMCSFILTCSIIPNTRVYMAPGVPWVFQIVKAFNTLRPRQNGHLFPDNIFKWMFLNENIWISLRISLKFVPRVRIDNIPALVQIMTWRRAGDKPLSEPMMVCLLMHICVTQPQWVNKYKVSGDNSTQILVLYTHICIYYTSI